MLESSILSVQAGQHRDWSRYYRLIRIVNCVSSTVQSAHTEGCEDYQGRYLPLVYHLLSRTL